MTGQAADEFYREQLRLLIWSGFFNEDDLEEYLSDFDHDQEARQFAGALAGFARGQFAAKREAEARWPKRTDPDRIDTAFVRLQGSGILGLANAGYTMSDAHDDAWAVIDSAAPGTYRGYCFYHGQDVERVVEGGPLWLGFDVVAGGAEAKLEVGREVVAAMRAEGLQTSWNDDPERRIDLTGLDWKRRTRWRTPRSNGGFLGKLFGA